jgi:asparagine synthase (glutamine-hydrolysing)
MCGITGLIYNDSEHPVQGETIHAMNQAQLHRGPDDEGIWTEANVGLGHRRLSIIDLSEAGHQPMTNEDKSLWLVFNGEIYNFHALRKECINRGHVFHSDTDSEVILHLYEEYGDDVVTHLNGMFSFALWDSRKRRLLLAVDRIGKKPLRYSLGKFGLAFSSEIRPLLTLDEVDQEMDRQAMWHYLTLGYIPAPMTGYTNISKLPAAHRLIYENGKARIERYWQLDFSQQQQRSEEEWQEAILELLEDAVVCRMESDVPLGAFLSGGVDSSAIVAMMASNSSRPIRTFSIGFEEEDYNELPAARFIAEKYNTDHTELVVKPSAMDVFPKLVDCYGEPYADSSALPSYYLAQVTRQHVTVALNGDGGDENFAGYSRYSNFVGNDSKLSLPRRLGMGTALGALGQCLKPFAPRAASKLTTAADLCHHDPVMRYMKYISVFDSRSLRELVSDSFYKEQSGSPSHNLISSWTERDSAGHDDLDQLLYADIHQYLPYDLMVKIDIATMAHSLEGRSPLLDYRMLELSASMPINMKLRNGEKKYIFKKALSRLLPQEHLNRKKVGFGIPLQDWFRGELKELACDMLLSSRLAERGILRSEAVKSVLESHISGQQQQGRRIWSLLFLEMWYRRWIEGKGGAE